jgi:RNA polymerase sigma-70 factor (ECF subfamily)
MDTDDALIAGLTTDLDGTFEALVRAHQDRLYSIALRMLGNPADAEEAAQDAFVRAYRALAGYDRERIAALKLRSWLATIMLNLCRSRRSRTVAERSTLSLDLALPVAAEPTAATSAAPVAVAERRASGEAWATLLLTLPPAQREAVVLRHVDGLSYPDLAIALGKPEGTVKAQVHRGLAQLRAAYESAQRLHPEEMTA